jgi:branched-chain amino acid transport system substrate-binding protein
MKRLRVVMGAAACALVLTVTACSKSNAGNDGSGSGSSGSIIKIGAWMPLTGVYASVGIPQQAGFDAWVKQTNDAGGINGQKIEWEVKDNQFDPQQTIQVARTMVADGVQAFVAPNGTSQAQAAFPFVLNQSKVPIVFDYGGLATWYNPTQPMLFGSQTLYENQAAAVGQWAAQDGHTKIMVVHDDPAAYVTVANAVEPGVKATNASLSVTQLSVKSGTTDYAPIVSQVKAAKPDAVILITPYTEAATYLKQAKLQGLSAQTYGYVPATDTGLIKLAGADAEGFKGVQLVKPLSDTGSGVAAYKAAMAKYESGQDLSFYSLTTYAEGVAFGQVLSKIKGKVTSQSIAAALENNGPFDSGILPPLSYSSSKHLGTDQVQRVSVQNGQFVASGGFISPPKASS